MEKILTVQDVADLLKVRPITVREMFREKRLRGFKVGKSWRTTEKMLEEDVAAMASAHGTEVSTQPPPPRKRKAKSKLVTPPAADIHPDGNAAPEALAVPQVVVPEPAVEEQPEALPEPPPAVSARPRRKALSESHEPPCEVEIPASEESDDSQQLLF